MNWAMLIAFKMADLTQEGQARGKGIAGDTDLAGMARLQEALGGRLLEAYLKLTLFHELRPTISGRNSVDQHTRAQILEGVRDPRGSGRAVSVVIPCCGQLEFTRMCLPSVLRHSRPPYELVLVDLASLDGTSDYLAGVATAAHVPVIVTRIEHDMDFAAAYNAGIAQCHGEFVVLLNNDTIVTEGWLGHLVSLAGVNPLIGMVGAMSNYAPPPQCTGPVPYGVVQEERRRANVRCPPSSHRGNRPLRAALAGREQGEVVRDGATGGLLPDDQTCGAGSHRCVRFARSATVLGGGFEPPDAERRLPACLLPGFVHPSLFGSRNVAARAADIGA